MIAIVSMWPEISAEIITVLLWSIGLFALLQPSAPRAYAAIPFAGLTLLHEIVFPDLDGLAYYGSAALIDLAMIILMSGINPVPRMVLNLHKICLVSIGVNALGWIMWYVYWPPWVYDTMFTGIYAWTLAALIKRDKDDVGGYALGSWATCFCFNRSSWRGYVYKHKGAP